ncbi:methyltransferase domain-containing protein [Candidatus Omnitrophota bacterium]
MKCLLCDKDTQEIVTKRLRNGEKRNVYYCEECEVTMLDNNCSDVDLREFYDKKYRKKFKPKLNKGSSPQELFDIYSNFQEGRIQLIKKFLTKEMRLLEVGCSAGMFLSHVKNYVSEIVGIDYDSEAARFASKKCSCPVFDNDIEDTDLDEQTFDIICMFQTLEHVKDPHKFLEKYRRYLKPKGIMYVEVPNLYDSLISAYNLPGHHNFYFHSAHSWYFTEKSLNILMQRAKFGGKIYFSQDYNIINHMHWISADAPQQDCIQGLSAPYLPLRDNLELHKKEELNSFIKRVDFEYKEMLVKLGITSNLSFIGRKISNY